MYHSYQLLSIVIEYSSDKFCFFFQFWKTRKCYTNCVYTPPRNGFKDRLHKLQPRSSQHKGTCATWVSRTHNTIITVQVKNASTSIFKIGLLQKKIVYAWIWWLCFWQAWLFILTGKYKLIDIKRNRNLKAAVPNERL